MGAAATEVPPTTLTSVSVVGGHDVVVREACRAAGFPTGDRVHKLRKPVRFDVAGRSVQTP